jgi:hypothetical protein
LSTVSKADNFQKFEVNSNATTTTTALQVRLLKESKVFEDQTKCLACSNNW